MDSRHREELIEKIKNETFDLLVIGGGVLGASVALDATLRGVKTVLIEKNDFASGSSSKSTKVFNTELQMPKWSKLPNFLRKGRQRWITNRIVPHMVRPERSLIPIIKNGKFTAEEMDKLIRNYELIGGVEWYEQRKHWTVKKTREYEWWLQRPDLLSSILYTEYITDDARITTELIKTAGRSGALSLNYTEVLELNYLKGKVCGASVKEKFSHDEFEIKAKCVVLATGPAGDSIFKREKSSPKRAVELSKGAHIVIPYRLLPLEHTLYFEGPDGQMHYAIPRGISSYVGTTENKFTGDKNDLRVTANEVLYLLRAINFCMPNLKIKFDEVSSSWAGLRPRVFKKDNGEFNIHPDVQVHKSTSGLISVTGGDLSSYRLTGKKVATKVLRHLNGHWSNSKTKRYPLDLSKWRDRVHVNDILFDVVSYVNNIGMFAYSGRYLIRTYGKIGRYIIYMGKSDHMNPEVQVTVNETYHSLRYENIQTLCDFFIRRTARIYFDIDSIRMTRSHVCGIMAEELGWDEQRIQEEQAALDKEIERATVFVLDD